MKTTGINYKAVIMAGVGCAAVIVVGSAFFSMNSHEEKSVDKGDVQVETVSYPARMHEAGVGHARAAQAASDYRLALLYLDHVLVHNPDQPEALVLMGDIIRQKAEGLISDEAYLEAGRYVARGRQHLANYIDHIITTEDDAYLLEVVPHVEGQLDRLTGLISARVQVTARRNLAVAESYYLRSSSMVRSVLRGDVREQDTYSRVWRNDRHKVREGLRELYWINEHWDYVPHRVRSDFFRVMGLLKQRVADKEWDQLMAEAGWFYQDADSQMAL